MTSVRVLQKRSSPPNSHGSASRRDRRSPLPVLPVSAPLDRMDIPTLRHYLDDADAAHEFLKSLGVIDFRRAHAALVSIASAGVTLDLLALICEQLGQTLARCPDPDMALNNLDRFVAQARNPLSMGTLFERDATALPSLVQIFSTSQHFSDLLIADPEGFDLLRLTGSPGRPADARRRPCRRDLRLGA